MALIQEGTQFLKCIFLIFILCAWMFVCTWYPYTQEEALDLMWLELQMVMKLLYGCRH